MLDTIPLLATNEATPQVLKNNSQENENTSHRLEENICKGHFL